MPHRTEIRPDIALARRVCAQLRVQLDLMQRYVASNGKFRQPEGVQGQAVLTLVREGVFLPGFTPSQADAKAALGAIEEHCERAHDWLIEVAAYFLGYRYLALGGSPTLPATEFERIVAAYGAITAAPWLGEEPRWKGEDPPVNPQPILSGLRALVLLGFVEFAAESTLDNYPVIRLAERLTVSEPAVAKEIAAAGQDLQEQELDRKSVCEDLGRTLPHLSNEITTRVMQEAPAGSIIKWVIYHGKTVFDWLKDEKAPLQALLLRKPDLRMQILLVGPGAVPQLLEGASRETFLKSVSGGAGKLRKLPLEASTSRRIDIRAYGTSAEDGMMRGIMVVMPTGSIKSCLMTNWRFERDRANYGEILRLSGESNLAMLMRDRFDQVFERSVPLRGWRVKLLWLWQRGLLKLTAAIVAAVLLVVAAKEYDQRELSSAAWFAAGLFPGLWKGVWKTAKDMWKHHDWRLPGDS